MSHVKQYLRLRARFDRPAWRRRWMWTAHGNATQREMDRLYALLTAEEQARVGRWLKRRRQR